MSKIATLLATPCAPIKERLGAIEYSLIIIYMILISGEKQARHSQLTAYSSTWIQLFHFSSFSFQHETNSILQLECRSIEIAKKKTNTQSHLAGVCPNSWYVMRMRDFFHAYNSAVRLNLTCKLWYRNDALNPWIE